MRFVPDVHDWPPPSAAKSKCVGPAQFTSDMEVNWRSKVYFEVTYLPPGVALHPPRPSLICGGEVMGFGYESVGLFLDFGRGVLYGDPPAWLAVAHRDRLSTGKIRGKPAVFVSQIPGAKWSTAFVFVVEEPGVLTKVEGFGYPLDELKKVAEGMR
jgi:hypothetical protein